MLAASFAAAGIAGRGAGRSLIKMSELAKKAAAIARAKRAKFICKASRWEGPLEEMSPAGDHRTIRAESVGGQAFSRHSATAPALRVDFWSEYLIAR